MKNCLIKDISSSDHGGAFCISSSSLSLNINETTFYQCISTNGCGGAIYFASSF